MARDNKSLGRFHLGGIPPAPARIPQIEVTFDIDANGILNVSALEKGTGQKQSITITGSGNLGKEEIERMVREAELNAETDRKAQELIELRNKAEQLAFQTEKTVKELGEDITEAQRQSVEEKITSLRTAIQGDNEADIEAAYNALETESHAISKQLYEKASAAADHSEEHQETAGVGAAGHGGEEVIDAEFKEEK